MSVPMEDECEVYDAELNAIALTSEKMEKIVKNKQTNIKDIWIFCDSQLLSIESIIYELDQDNQIICCTNQSSC
jgi:hypothetical protein